MAAISESRSWCTETEDNVIFWQRTRDSLVEMTLSIQAGAPVLLARIDIKEIAKQTRTKPNCNLFNI